MDKLNISVVVPLYNEAESLPELAAWIDRVMRENGFSYELILIDDGSSDGSWEEVERLKTQYPASVSRATTASPRPSTADSRLRKARSSLRWTPTCRIRPTKSPSCAA